MHEPMNVKKCSVFLTSSANNCVHDSADAVFVQMESTKNILSYCQWRK